MFVAHREEILKQSMDTFRVILKDSNFGDMLVGPHTPTSLDHLFVSIQSFNSKKLYEHTSKDFYDFIIVDEFHHAAAASYQALLRHYQPSILLGLTATPERMDEQNILDHLLLSSNLESNKATWKLPIFFYKNLTQVHQKTWKNTQDGFCTVKTGIGQKFVTELLSKKLVVIN